MALAPQPVATWPYPARKERYAGGAGAPSEKISNVIERDESNGSDARGR